MRAPATVLGAGLSAAAALLLTACGGSDAEPDAAPSSAAPATSSAAAGSSDTSGEDVQAFCTEVETVFSRVSAAFDPADVSGSLDETLAAFGEVRPPAEISAQWTAIQDGLQSLRDTVAGTDVSTPAGQAAAQAALTDFQAETSGPQQDLEQYVTANCDSAGTSAPTPAPSS
jgi:hypothetical protein